MYTTAYTSHTVILVLFLVDKTLHMLLISAGNFNQHSTAMCETSKKVPSLFILRSMSFL